MATAKPSKKRLLTDFIIPALDSEKFGYKLYWLKKDEEIFRIFWGHKRSKTWRAEDFVVFTAWDIEKGRYNVKNLAASKGRFRAAMKKLRHLIREIGCPVFGYKDFQFCTSYTEPRCWFCGNRVEDDLNNPQVQKIMAEYSEVMNKIMARTHPDIAGPSTS
ncbi:hypothetical protein HNY73_016246 [Argiope bruennichi]|uniref:IRF tryptophan pentad repeat domain-containing protein n=1 Tax=Argiope bruennichi TaxID=94029 RepID=A0A8T0EN02_ARGBR|nr:hypothetical protein HNY73_016246 [Argiope bruennichi]